MGDFVDLVVDQVSEVDEGEDHHDHHHATCPIVEAADHLVARGEVVLVADVETSEVTVLGCLTAIIQAKIVSEVLLIAIPHETMAVAMILSIDLQDRSEITQLHAIIRHTVHVTILAVIETTGRHHVNGTTLRITARHETILRVIVTTPHLVAGTTHLAVVITSFHELMTWIWLLAAMVPGIMTIHLVMDFMIVILRDEIMDLQEEIMVLQDAMTVTKVEEELNTRVVDRFQDVVLVTWTMLAACLQGDFQEMMTIRLV